MWSKGNRASVALWWRNESLTYGELADRVGKLMVRIAKRPGVIAVRARNDIASVVTLLAALEAERPVALLPDGPLNELAAFRAMLGRAVEIDTSGEVVWEARDQPVIHHLETALIAFTSGSSGQPRAVQLSRRHLEKNASNCIAMIEMGEVREQTLFAPISHLFALFGHLLPGLRAGIETRLYSGVVEVRAAIEHGEARGILSGVPAHWEALLRYSHGDPTPVTRVVSSGAPLSEILRVRLAERFDRAVILNCYGLSEAPRILALSNKHPRFFSDATGLPTSGVELQVAEGGELKVRGELVMLGYLGAPELTADRLREGWLYTGDAAQVDTDGVFTVLGRRDDIHKIGAERVSLVEVDHELMRLPGVEDAAATVTTDEIYGERLVAFLVGSVELASRSRSELRDEMAKRIAWHKVPTRIYVVIKLPRNRAGKIQRACLGVLRDNAKEL